MRTKRRTNKLANAVLCCLALFATSREVLAQDTSVTVPRFDDQYSKLVRRLEAGETSINYREFRDSFLESEQFKVVGNEQPNLDTLRKTLHELMQTSKYADIVAVAKKMLSLDYTDMEAHKILQQTYKKLGDVSNQKKYHDIEFGLLNSIVKSGDGKTCRTGWPVIQVTEEYFILAMLGAKVLQQSVDPEGPCDRIEAQTDQGKTVYYFEISQVFKGYHKRGIH
jgi:hypothetical protein